MRALTVPSSNRTGRKLVPSSHLGTLQPSNAAWGNPRLASLQSYAKLSWKSSVYASKMADPSKGAPQPFNASLFGSGGGSSLSFDLDTSVMASPIVIGPASKGKDSASSTPPQTRSASPSSASLSGSKTRPAPTVASLFSTPSSGPTSANFNALLAQPPEPHGPIPTPETELETVDLGSPTTTTTVEPPSNPQPFITPMPLESTFLHGPTSSAPPPTALQPPVTTMPPVPPQAVPEMVVGGGGGGEESNPYRLSARHLGRPLHQAMAPPTQTPFLGSSIMPPAPPPAVETLGIPPPMSSAPSGYSPILPPPTSGGYQGGRSEMAPPMFYTSSASGVYQPVRPHWFYLRSGDSYWTPFTLVDSSRWARGCSGWVHCVTAGMENLATTG